MSRLPPTQLDPDHLRFELWPIDHSDLPFVIEKPHLVRYQENGSKNIAQIELAIDKREVNTHSKDILKTLNKWPSPFIKDLSLLDTSPDESIELDAQFVFHTLPSLEINDANDVVKFIERFGAITLEEYPNVQRTITTVSQNEIHKEKINHRSFSFGKRSTITAKILEVNTAIAMLRDLKAMAMHIIIASQNEHTTTAKWAPEWEPWEEAGYTFTDPKYALIEARQLLVQKMHLGLKDIRFTLILNYREGDSDERVNTRLKTGIYQAACFQLYEYQKEHREIKKCQHTYCPEYFINATGYGKIRSQRTTGVKYCSKECLKAANQVAYRQRKKQGGKK